MIEKNNFMFSINDFTIDRAKIWRDTEHPFEFSISRHVNLFNY